MAESGPVRLAGHVRRRRFSPLLLTIRPRSARPLFELVKHLALAFLRDELIEISHHLVAPGNQRFDFVLV
jgi:hypothetical protein